MKTILKMMLLIGIFSSLNTSCFAAPLPAKATEGITLNTLLAKKLDVAENSDVIIDAVKFPPHSSIAKRWHPGELFVYVNKGSIVVSIDGEEAKVGTRGDLIEIPFKKLYTAHTNNEGAELTLFRVHQSGQPIRYNIQ